MRYLALVALAAVFCLNPALAPAYPLDGYEQTGIVRLEAYRLAQTGKVRGPLLPPGAQRPGDSVRLRLANHPNFEIPSPDPTLSAAIQKLLGADEDGYAITVLDLTDPNQPRYAAHNPNRPQNPGSVGKLMVALAWFQALADIYPGDTAARHALMRDARHTADSFIRNDHHTIGLWNPGDAAMEFRPIREGDEANLWTWLDWTMSRSSNAAASSVMAQLVLLSHFGAQYPRPTAEASAFLRDTPKSKLTNIYANAIQKPLTRNGLDLDKLRQGNFFTREGKSRIPGVAGSVATPLELLRFLIKMEQGKLVDPYSSLEMKRLIYLTERRIRYAASPALRRASLYFKSGSLYSCKPEPGFTCGKYEGNVRNYLNSATIVETDEPGRKLHYIVVLLSNVLRKNSAVIHRDLATEIHQLMENYHPLSASTPEPTPVSSRWSDPSSSAGPHDEIDSDEETELP